jgi:uncharacterized protein DUF397
MIIWRKSSYSEGANTDCVEAARLETGARGLRDSKSPERGHLNVSKAGFAALIREVKAS